MLACLRATTTGGPITETRINQQITASQVRLIGPDGEQVGVVPTPRALALAGDVDLDLVEVAPQARPPVCKLLDYGKYKYESDQKQRAQRRAQQAHQLKEIKLRPRIGRHDYETKRGHVRRFIAAGHKVKVTIMFRGREQARPELGRLLLDRLTDDLADIAAVEHAARQEGRNMFMTLAPAKE